MVVRMCVLHCFNICFIMTTTTTIIIINATAHVLLAPLLIINIYLFANTTIYLVLIHYKQIP